MPKPLQLMTSSKGDKMQWQHYNSIKSTMRYIEGLLHEIDASLTNKESLVYLPVEIDLSKEQINQIKKQLKELYSLLKKAKTDFDLNTQPIKLSRIIDTNTVFIWKTIEDSWSSEMEEKSGKMSSDDKKKQIDELLNKILKFTNKIRESADEHSLG